MQKGNLVSINGYFEIKGSYTDDIYAEEVEEIDTTDAYTNGGILPDFSPDTTDPFIGSVWIVTKYKPDGFAQVILSPPDTITFSTAMQADWTVDTLSLSTNYFIYQSGGVYKMEFYSSPRFGYISGTIPGNFMLVGEINLAEFVNNDIGGNGITYRISMERL